MVDGKELSQAGFKYLGRSYDEMDCQKFIEQCLKDCGNGTDLAGSNAWYRRVMNEGWVGTPEECVSKYGTVPPGAFLFILEFDGGEEKRGYHDGLGNASHIGIVTGKKGNGHGAIHSSHSKGCVCESNFSGKTVKSGGWNRVGLWTKAVDYGIGGGGSDSGDDEDDPTPTPTPDPEPETRTAIVWADNGLPVKMRQEPSVNCRQYWELNVGTVVDVYEDSRGKDGSWSKIGTQIKNTYAKGFMMTKFLAMQGGGSDSGDEGGSGGSEEELCTITIYDISRDEVERLKQKYPKTEIAVG